jgi:hypothetical protein
MDKPRRIKTAIGAAWPSPADWEQYKLNLARLKDEEPERYREALANLRKFSRELEELESEQFFLWAALSAHEVDTLEQARTSAENLFSLIEIKHGPEAARRIFSELGGAEKRDRNALHDRRLRGYYESLNSLAGGRLSMRRFAEFLSRNSTKAGWWFGLGRRGDATTTDAIRKRLEAMLKSDE